MTFETTTRPRTTSTHPEGHPPSFSRRPRGSDLYDFDLEFPQTLLSSGKAPLPSPHDHTHRFCFPSRGASRGRGGARKARLPIQVHGPSPRAPTLIPSPADLQSQLQAGVPGVHAPHVLGPFPPRRRRLPLLADLQEGELTAPGGSQRGATTNGAPTMPRVLSRARA
jgi:hypothetical protein